MKDICLFFVLVSTLAAEPSAVPQKRLPLPGEVFLVAERTAFIIPGKIDPATKSKPWVWYAPTLTDLPGNEERWMFDQFIAAGIAIAGIDVGESYGSPAGRTLFTALYKEMTGRRGYSTKPILLGRSRGGLMTLSWAAENPDKVAAFAGIYPVCDIASYPSIATAAGAYGMTADELRSQLDQHNPVARLADLAKAHVPFFAIHGNADKLVPLVPNSALLKERYTALGGAMELIIPAGQGHSMWNGFFQCQALVEFVKKNSARP